MKPVNMHEAKTHFSSLLATIEQTGESIVVCRDGKPVANLTPIKRRDRLKPHPELRRIKVDYDPTEPLSDQEWPEAFR